MGVIFTGDYSDKWLLYFFQFYNNQIPISIYSTSFEIELYLNNVFLNVNW